MIHTYNNGETLLMHNVGVAKMLSRGWKVNSLIGPVWESIYIPGKMTDVKIVAKKAEARKLILELQAISQQQSMRS